MLSQFVAMSGLPLASGSLHRAVCRPGIAGHLAPNPSICSQLWLMFRILLNAFWVIPGRLVCILVMGWHNSSLVSGKETKLYGPLTDGYLIYRCRCQKILLEFSHPITIQSIVRHCGAGYWNRTLLEINLSTWDNHGIDLWPPIFIGKKPNFFCENKFSFHMGFPDKPT